MIETLREIFDPNFLLRNSVYTGLIIGATCPLVGIYLILRRQVFLGVALPQVSSCGIALAFGLHAWGLIPHLEESREHNLAFFGASTLTVACVLVLAWLDRRGGGVGEGRIGTAYALAGAWSILLLVKNPYGEHGLLDRLRGEIISISNQDLIATAIVLMVATALLVVFRREFMLVSFDRNMAITLKKRVVWWDSLLLLLTALTISKAVLSVGPLVTFGFLILPPLTAKLYASNMRQFAVIASLVGAATATAGFAIAYRHDIPVGPTDVALLGLIYGLALALRPLWRLWRGSKPAQA